MHAALIAGILFTIGIFALLNRYLAKTGSKATKLPAARQTPPGSRNRFIDIANNEESRLRPHIHKCLAQPQSLEMQQRLEDLLKRMLKAHFSRAVAQSTSPQQFSTELKSARTLEVFEQYLGLFRDLPSDQRNRLVTGIYLNEVALEAVAIPILIGRTDLAREYSALAMPYLRGVDFLNEKGLALRALLDHRPYKKGSFGAVTGVWKHQTLYLDLIEAITNHRSYDRELDAVESSFKKLTKNKRNLEVDFLDPSGRHELDWDCRLAYILEAARLCGWERSNTIGTSEGARPTN